MTSDIGNEIKRPLPLTLLILAMLGWAAAAFLFWYQADRAADFPTKYYVDLRGLDANQGTIDKPFASLQHAHDIAAPGDTIHLRGGTYKLTTGIHLTNDGTNAAPIKIQNYPGERPILDGYGIGQKDEYILELNSVSNNHIKGLEIRGGPEGGVLIHGASNSNVIEQLDVHHNGRLSQWEGKGISLYGSGASNLLLNNDSHDNRDIRGDNADGFQISSTGEGNVLRGNRAWGNSDDGIDLFNVQMNTKAAPAVLDHNWAFDNGYDANGKPLGDGTGFKLGGNRVGSSGESGGHILTGNIAWGNRTIGFDQSEAGDMIPNKLYNNTAYNNGDYNYGFWSEKNMFQDNISFGTGKLATSGTNQHNSWNINGSPSSYDFLSLDDSVARGPRQTDGSLPDTAQQKLAAARDQLASAQQAITDRSQELATVGKRLALARQQEAQVSQKVETLTRETSSRADELAKAEVRLQQSREATAGQEQQLSALRTQVTQVAGQLSDLNKELAARNADLSRLEDQLQAARKRLSETGATAGSSPVVPGADQPLPATPSPAPTGGAAGQ